MMAAASRRLNPTLVTGIGVMCALVLFALLGPLISGYSTTETAGSPMAGPSGEHWLGTDNIGRDTFTRLAVATRFAIAISFCATVIAMVVGTAVGLLAGYVGGRLDNVLMRLTEVVMAVPAILLALVVRVTFGPGVLPLIAAMAIVGAPGFARIMRSPILVLRNRDFVVAAEVAGVRGPRIALTHLLPNATTPMLVNFANTASLAVLIESSLSYLGQGVQPPDPSAGRMISEFQRFMYDNPMLVVLPAILITLLTVAWNLLADGLQDALSPRAGHLAVRSGARRRRRTTVSTVAATPPQPIVELDAHGAHQEEKS